MGGTPTDQTPAGEGLAAAGKIRAAFELLVSAFEDTRLDAITPGKDELLEQIAAAQYVLNVAWGVQAARLAQVAAIEPVRFPDHTSPSGFRERAVAHPIGTHQDEFIGCEIGPLMGWTSGQAVGRVSEAADMITRTPRLFARVGTGELEPAKLAAIHRAIGRTIKELGDDGHPVTIDVARTVETALLGDVHRDDDSAQAAAVVQENVQLIARQSNRQLRHRTERILRTVDQVAADKAATKRRRDRVGVFTHPDDEPGLTHLHAILDSAIAAQLMSALDQLARDVHADTSTDKTLAECRADALADLALGNATVATKLLIQVPVHVRADTTSPSSGDAASAAPRVGQGAAFWPAAFAHPITGLTVLPHGRPTAARAGSLTPTGVRVKSQRDLDIEFNELMKTLWPPDPDDYPPDVFDDYQPIDRDDGDDGPPAWWRAEPSRPPAAATQPGVSTALLGDAIVPGVGVIPAAVICEMSRSFGTTITRALVDANTGVTVETNETQYRPSHRLADFVRARDGHCRFPGCARAARWCDIDHVVPWPARTTAAWNLQCLCRHHHRTKQEQHWHVAMTADGVCTWTSPSGRTYTTVPGE